MPQQKITITVDENGRIVAYAEGFKGEATLEMLEDLLNEDSMYMTHGIDHMFKEKLNINNKKQIIQELK